MARTISNIRTNRTVEVTVVKDDKAINTEYNSISAAAKALGLKGPQPIYKYVTGKTSKLPKCIADKCSCITVLDATPVEKKAKKVTEEKASDKKK